MKSVILQIDLALKRLYNLHSPLSAVDFLVRKPVDKLVHGAPAGALYIVEPGHAHEDLYLGIYLNSETTVGLESFSHWGQSWSTAQIAAFGVAAEEISHFHYLAHHAPTGRGVSHLELELQGEIDKFLLTFFAQGTDPERFGSLLDQYFQNYSWFEQMSAEQKARYEAASRLAKTFLVKNAGLACDVSAREKFLRFLREFYRLSLEEKISRATP